MVGDAFKVTSFKASELLLAALMNGNVSKVNEMMEHGADPNEAVNRGMPPLHWAAIFDDVLAMDSLILAGADVDLQAVDGATPLHMAVREECEAAVGLLLRYGAQPNLRNHAGKRPIEELQDASTSSTITAMLQARGGGLTVAPGSSCNTIVQQAGEKICKQQDRGPAVKFDRLHRKSALCTDSVALRHSICSLMQPRACTNFAKGLSVPALHTISRGPVSEAKGMGDVHVRKLATGLENSPPQRTVPMLFSSSALECTAGRAAVVTHSTTSSVDLSNQLAAANGGHVDQQLERSSRTVSVCTETSGISFERNLTLPAVPEGREEYTSDDVAATPVEIVHSSIIDSAFLRMAATMEARGFGCVPPVRKDQRPMEQESSSRTLTDGLLQAGAAPSSSKDITEMVTDSEDLAATRDLVAESGLGIEVASERVRGVLVSLQADSRLSREDYMRIKRSNTASQEER